MAKRTDTVRRFFMDELRFSEQETVYFTEEEARSLSNLLDQTNIFKRYNPDLEQRLQQLARHSFSGRPAGSREMLTVFLNESRDESVSDFIINRNPEFAYSVVWKRHDEIAEADRFVSDYLLQLKPDLESVGQLRFCNTPTFFKSNRDFLRFCARDRTFKPGTGQFDLIYDLDRKLDQIIKSNFDFLEKRPVRMFQTSQHALATPTKNGDILIVEIVDRTLIAYFANIIESKISNELPDLGGTEIVELRRLHNDK